MPLASTPLSLLTRGALIAGPVFLLAAMVATEFELGPGLVGSSEGIETPLAIVGCITLVPGLLGIAYRMRHHGALAIVTAVFGCLAAFAPWEPPLLPLAIMVTALAVAKARTAPPWIVAALALGAIGFVLADEFPTAIEVPAAALWLVGFGAIGLNPTRPEEPRDPERAPAG